MVDFNKLSTSGRQHAVQSPIDIFNRLPKPEYIDDLHQSQYEVLERWFSSRDSRRDFVVKLHTGGGKTLVGLLMALSSAKELKKGALYLVDNRQLADQVVSQAAEIGISATPYNGKSSLNAEFRNGDTILVASYQALFNGLSAFGKLHDVEYEDISIIVFDDAHSAFEAVRDAFTVTIFADDDVALYRDICALFRRDFEKIDRQSTFDDFTDGVRSIGSEVLEVPFWSWLSNSRSVERLLSKKARSLNCRDENDTASSLKFSWPLIKNELKYCRAMVSSKAFTITPYLPLVDLFPTYHKAPRRLFMSATFADDGAIIRAFEPEDNELPETISPQTLAGVGRRMILPLDEQMLPIEMLVEKMKDFSHAKKGTVVLVPGLHGVERWRGYGMEIATKNDISAIVERLKRNLIDNPVVFVNRYNGIDLPKDACRILVIDGIPKGASDYDKLSSSTLSGSSLYARAIAQTIEQAIGRGTRGSGDFCTVLLIGEDLCEWVKDRRHLKYFSLPTQAQIVCGMEVMDDISDAEEYLETINQGANGDQDYASYLSNYMGNYLKDNTELIDDELVSFAKTERQAFHAWRRGDEGEALSICRSFGDSLAHDDALRGYIYQFAAQISYSCENIVDASALQKKAHECNGALSKSVPMPSGEPATEQARSIVNCINGIEKSSDVLSVFDQKTKGLLKGSSSEEFEKSLVSLGSFIGFDAKHFDNNGFGPDVLWMLHSEKFGLVFEAKSGKKDENPLSKTEHGQLLVAEKWFYDQYLGYECVIASVHPDNRAFHNASATSTHVLTFESLDKLAERVRSLWLSIKGCPPHEDVRLSKCDSLLDEYKLRRNSFVGEYFKLFGS